MNNDPRRGGRGTVPSYGRAARGSGPEFSGRPGIRPRVFGPPELPALSFSWSISVFLKGNSMTEGWSSEFKL